MSLFHGDNFYIFSQSSQTGAWHKTVAAVMFK